ncbi:MAG TPA: hypothetical protein PLP19_03825 [bacterium]|nr:hypothetical protein [bacterium]HPN42596.1 hypothetical protein [bacterium]
MKIVFLYISIVLWFCIAGSLTAQPGLILETSGGYSSNVFHNYQALPDYYTDIDAYLHQDWIFENQGLRTFYNGALTSFDRYKDKNYQNHTLGISWYRLLNHAGNRLNAGISVMQRDHSEEYQWVELFTTHLYVNSKIIINEQLYSYFGLNLTSRRYKNLPAFSHFQSVLFARMSKFFTTGTTLILEGDIINKQYYPESTASYNPDFPEVVTVGDGNSTSGIVLLRLAQAITPKTGLSLQLQSSKNFITSERYLGNTEGFYYSDEEMFDDMFGYNDAKIELGLTQTLPWKSKLLLQNYMQWKKYIDRPAFDLLGNPLNNSELRNDKRWVMDITLEKRLNFSSAIEPLTISINWTNVNNYSNDAWYDYKSGYLMFSLEQNL